MAQRKTIEVASGEIWDSRGRDAALRGDTVKAILGTYFVIPHLLPDDEVIMWSKGTAKGRGLITYRPGSQTNLSVVGQLFNGGSLSTAYHSASAAPILFPVGEEACAVAVSPRSFHAVGMYASSELYRFPERARVSADVLAKLLTRVILS